jgi:hypothetical protein
MTLILILGVRQETTEGLDFDEMRSMELPVTSINKEEINIFIKF